MTWAREARQEAVEFMERRRTPDMPADPLREAALAATPGHLAELRAIAEDAALWQDYWDNHGGDDDAVSRHMTAWDPRTCIALLDEVALLRAALDMIAHPVAHGYPDPQDRATLAHWMTRVARLALSGAEMDRLALVAGSGR